MSHTDDNKINFSRLFTLVPRPHIPGNQARSRFKEILVNLRNFYPESKDFLTTGCESTG